MKRLVKKIVYVNDKIVEPDPEEAVIRLANIEDILGDDYDLDRLRELVEAHRDRRCVIYQKGFPVASTYYKQIDGLCVREASGVVSEEEYEAAVKRGWDG